MSEPLINISRKQALYFAAFLVFYEFLTYIANDMIMPGMIHVVNSFHGDESAVASSLTAYVLGGASLQIFLGPISDRFGRRPVMLSGAALFFIGTLFIACSNSMEQFILARFFEGMGLCFIGVIGYAVLQEIFSEMDAVRLVAILANVSILAPLLGPLAGALFILYFNWRVIFIVIASLALLVFCGLWRYMPEPIGAIKKDGQLIPRVSLAPKVVYANYKHLLSSPPFVIGALLLGVLGVPCIAWIGISPLIIIKDAQLSVIDYALWQIPIFGACIIGTWILHKLSHYISLRKIILIGSAIAVSGLILSYLLPLLISTYFLWLMPGLTLYGIGFGISCGPLNRYALFVTPISKGTATAMLSMINMAVQGLGIEVSNHIYINHSNLNFGLFCALMGIVYLIGMVFLFSLKDIPS